MSIVSTNYIFDFDSLSDDTMFGLRLYSIFFWTYLKTSFLCLLMEMIYPTMRVNTISRKQILANYYNMAQSIGLNLVVGVPYFGILGKYLNYPPFMQYQQFYFMDAFLNFIWFLNYFVAWVLITDVFFYSIHRMFHNPRLYWLHAKHHEYRYTHGAGAIYASIPDFVLANLVPASIPIYILGIPQNYTRIIIAFISFYTVFISHSGFNFRKSHLLHHIKFKVNFGLVFMDRLCKTKMYIENK